MKTKFSSETKWNPRGSQLLLVPTVEEEKSKGGIVIPDSVRRKATSGFVAKKGPDVASDIWIGDEVFFEQHSEFHIVLDDIDEEAFLLNESNILLHRRPEKEKRDVTSQKATVNVARYMEIDTTRLAGETDTDYNFRMGQQSPSGYAWNALSEDYYLLDDSHLQPRLPLEENNSSST